MRSTIDGPVLHLRTRWIFPEAIIVFQVARRSDRSGLEAPATIRADVAKDRLDASGAEGALITADARFERIRWQRFVIQPFEIPPAPDSFLEDRREEERIEHFKPRPARVARPSRTAGISRSADANVRWN